MRIQYPDVLSTLESALTKFGIYDSPFDETIAKVKATEGRLLVVMNGWDGLTTNVGSFNRLFNAHYSLIAIRVFADDPRRFFHVNIAQVIDIFKGNIVIDPSLAPEEEGSAIEADI